MPTPAMLLGMEAEKVQVRSTKNIDTALWLVTGSGSMSQKMLSPEAIISKLLCVSFTTGKCLRPGLEQRKMSYRHKSLDCVSGFLSTHNTFLPSSGTNTFWSNNEALDVPFEHIRPCNTIFFASCLFNKVHLHFYKH